MQVNCPLCLADYPLELLLQNEVDRRALAELCAISMPLGALTLRYLGLFKPATRRLSMDRSIKLLLEILPDMQRGAVTRKGRDWDAPQDSWRAAMEAIFAKRDKGTLALPLTSHGLLYEILASQANVVEARAEQQEEAVRRNHRPEGVRQAQAAPAARAGAEVLAALKQARARVSEAALAPPLPQPDPKEPA